MSGPVKLIPDKLIPDELIPENSINKISTNNIEVYDIIYFNVQSLIANKDQVESLVLKIKPLIIGLSETHLTNEIENWEVELQGYRICRVDSLSRHTGGVILYIADYMEYKIIETFIVNQYYWSISACIVGGLLANTIINVTYSSPKTKKCDTVKYLDDRLTLIESYIQLKTKVIIMGDFNVDLAKKTAYTNKMLKTIEGHGMTQIVKDFTRICAKKNKDNISTVSRTLIDYIIVSNEDTNDVFVNILDELISDHRIIGVKIKCNGRHKINRVNKTTGNKVIQFRDYNQISCKDFKNNYNQAITKVNWEHNLNKASTNLVAEEFINNVTMINNKFMPLKYRTLKNKYCNNKWFDQEIKDAIYEKTEAFKMVVKGGFLYNGKTESGNYNVYRAKRNELVNLIRNKKKSYYEKKISENAYNPRRMWQVLKLFYKGNKNVTNKKQCIIFDNNIYTIDADIANKFNRQFIDSVEEINRNLSPTVNVNQTLCHINVVENKFETFNQINRDKIIKIIKKIKPSTAFEDGLNKNTLLNCPILITLLTNIINTSLKEGYFPDNLKLSTVVPVPKISNTEDGNCFRPVNTTHIVGKIIENCVIEQLQDHVNLNNILSDCQSGFRNKYSCETALQLVICEWKKNIESSKLTVAVFIDLRKAFEMVNRDILILKLQKYGFEGKVLDWLTSYLLKREQRVKFNGTLSKTLPSVTGVPQGSVLGPFLFNLYVNDIANILQDCDIYMYADDIVICCSGRNVQEMIIKLNGDVKKLENWCECNKMKINPKKSKVMIVGSRNMLYKHNQDINRIVVNIDNEVIENVNQVKYLGVILDQQLNFKMYSDHLLKKLSSKVGLFRRINRCFSTAIKITLYKAIIAPYIDYCSSLLFLLNKNEIEAIQKQLNKAIRCILVVNRYTKIDEMYNTLSWLNARDRVLLNTLTFIFRIHKDLAPNYLVNKIQKYGVTHRYDTRCSRRNKNDCVVEKFLSKFSANTIFNKGIQIYNRVPLEIRNVSSVKLFRRECCRLIKRKLLIPLPYINRGFWDD